MVPPRLPRTQVASKSDTRRKRGQMRRSSVRFQVTLLIITPRSHSFTVRRRAIDAAALAPPPNVIANNFSRLLVGVVRG